MKKRIIIASLLSLFIGGLLSLSFINNINNKEVNAVANDKYLYVDLSLNDVFKDEGSNPYIKYKDDGEHIINLILINNDIYQSESTIPVSIFAEDKYNFTILCDNGGYSTDTIIGNTTPLKENNYNYLCLDEYVDGENASIKGFGYYTDINKNTDATYKTQRIWCTNTFINDETLPACNAVGYYSNTEWYISIMSSISNNGIDYYFVDIPRETISFSFLRLSSIENHEYLLYQKVEVSSISYGSCYTLSMNNNNLEVGITSVNGASAPMLGKVVEAYLTYGKADSNGATQSTMTKVFDTWFANKSATKEELKKEMIKDYTGYAKNGNSYEGLTTKDGTFSVNEKWNTMCSQAGIDPNTGKARSGNWFAWMSGINFKIVLTIGIGVLISAGGLIAYTIYRKKKQR